MEIRIGIANSPREISFESDQSASQIEQLVSAALESESKFLTLKDDKGTTYIVPTASLSFVEVGSEESRRVGFVA
ncbi:MAG: DUF3107 domain-containing protein [Salinibacterium sp.]|nr:MAG: DUF3107 domain-containing protein [Salinibacterium sp.]